MTVNVNDLESKRKAWNTGVKALAVLVLGFVVAPFIFIAIKGLIGIALALGLGFGALYFVPVIADKVANWRIKMIKAEAAKNPIETLQNDFGDKQQQLLKFKDSIEQFSAACMTFEDKLSSFKKEYPEDADKFDDQLDKMQQLLVVRKAKYKEAQGSLKQYASVIDRSKAIWNMAQEAAKMNKAAGMTDEDFLSKIKVETALDSVTTSMNTAFAELETSLEAERDEQKVLKLTEGSKHGKVIEETHSAKQPVRSR